ncbi:DUF211 domain-containing protein [Nanoarchaeota archaeon]
MPKPKSPVKLLVLDILKPHKPNIVEFSQSLTQTNGIENIDISVYAVDEKTESVKMVLEGSSLDFEIIRKTIEDFGAVIHSVDKVAAGKKICSYQLHELPHHFKPL